ncbi:MAG: ATP-binding protein [Candidatus Thiodiazotropha endolucinida]
MAEILEKDITIFRYLLGDQKYNAKTFVVRQYTGGKVSQVPWLTEYYVELPENLAHGFPNEWVFSFIRIDGDNFAEDLRNQLIQKINEIIHAHPIQKEIPVLFVSLTNIFQVSDELPPHRFNIFGIEIDEAHIKRQLSVQPVQPHRSPLVSAVRQSLTAQQWSEFWLSPYQKSKPADGWRFFGREKEIRKITQTMDNFVVVGARRIGKTSLLKELTRILTKEGYEVHNVDTQSSQNEKDLTNKLISELDEKTAVSLKRRQGLLVSSMLESVLKYLSGRGNVAILIDEIGNLLQRPNSEEAWKVMGTLRSHAHKGKIKLVCTASQKYLLKQQEEYSGPWVNFATTVVLRGLSREEARDFILKPIRIWRLITEAESRDIFELIYHNVGSHPLLLTAFCEALFVRVVGNKESIIDVARELLSGNEEGIRKAVHEVFFAINRPVIQYLFLQHCLQRYAQNDKLMYSIISESWIDKELSKAGYKSRFATRLFILEALNIRALTEPDSNREDQCRVIAPLVFNYSLQHIPLEKIRDSLREEITLDADEFGLMKV